MTREEARRWGMVVLGAILCLVCGAMLGTLRTTERLGAEHQRTIDQLEGELGEVGERLETAEDSLERSAAALNRTASGVVRSQAIASDLADELGNLTTGVGEIDDLIAAIRDDVIGIADELSSIPTTSP